MKISEKINTAEETTFTFYGGNLTTREDVSFFEDIDIEGVYSTNYIRTKNSAMPIASLKKTRIQYYESDYPKVFSESLLESKQNSLVVGHSNTIPILAGLLSGEDLDPINEKTYNRIYKIVISKDKRKLFILNAIYNCK